ncbi:type II toxin-antitoxin system VapC family toxin [Georgenia subflava]|uniref:Ribonuclease VapC n=1 Tax=Georgenia subflava TaxID=1622177 RepID=A0A6N7EH07_9MICO|nr:type II toxin-antitoxin system VapC family toxin [Georgenia subflava]MPV37330.1 PIN domain-containing protein [Georgenia subflava]
MIVYFDSSALVKLVVQEEGTELVATLWDACDAPFSSRLAYPEVRAALAAAGRAHRLGRRDRDLAERAFEDYWAVTQRVELSEAVTAHAGDLAGRYGLRGADAVHLASVFAVGLQNTVFAVWDKTLRAGAHAAGVRLAPAA